MKRKMSLTITLIIGLFIFNLSFSSYYPPGGGGSGSWVVYRYSVDVKGPNDNPLNNVDVRMIALYSLYLGGGSYYNGTKVVNGQTDSNGHVLLEGWVEVTGYYPEYYSFDYMFVEITEPGFSVISSQNTTSQFPTGYAEYVIIWDLDKDWLDDNTEWYLADKFKPILHKHSYDLQENLSDPVNWLSNQQTKLWVYRENDGVIYNNHVNSYHKPYAWNWCTFGQGSFTALDMRMDIPNNIWHSGAPVGSRPIFFHCYKEGDYFYLQYWYFFNSNDIREQAWSDAYHEGDFEHISLKIQYINSKYEPVAINFYQHEGGHTRTPSQCYWSDTNLPQFVFQQGYDEQHTHLHVWLAANSHASYNLNDLVYHITASEPFTEDYTDNYDSNMMMPGNLFFEYDILKKLGENYIEWYVEVHDQTWIYHYFPKGGEEWIAYKGRFGADYFQLSGVYTPSPHSPVFGQEWHDFSINYSSSGFGNTTSAWQNLVVNISWVPDPSAGDQNFIPD